MNARRSFDFLTSGKRMKSALRLLFALLNSGLAAVFVLLSYRVLSEAFSADSSDKAFQWPLSMVVLSGMYVVVSIVLVTSQVVAMLGRGGGRFLVLCVAFLEGVIILEDFSAHAALELTFGYRSVLVYLLLVSWTCANFWLWWPRGNSQSTL